MGDIETCLRNQGLRKTDQYFRYSSKDFAIMSPNVTKPQAETIAKRLGNVIKNSLMEIPDIKSAPVIHAGIVIYPEDSDREEQLVELVKIPSFTIE